jgi:DNA-directed RNA polymerase III subunit RPC1
MGVHKNLCTPKNGEILIAATQDFLTASYLLTSRDSFLDRAQVGLLVAMMGDALMSGAYSLHWSPYDRVGVVNADP